MKDKVLIGIPYSHECLYRAFTSSLMEMEKPCPAFVTFVKGYDVSKQRNDMVNIFMSGEYTHLLMLDTDIIAPPNALAKLLEADKEVISGFYMRRHYPYLPIFMKKTDKKYVMNFSFPEGGGVQQVDAVGTGICLFKREVFQKVPFPWFSFNKKTEDNEPVGEDIYFSVKASNAGISLWCHTDVICGHIATVSVMPVKDGEGKWAYMSLPVS